MYIRMHKCNSVSSGDLATLITHDCTDLTVQKERTIAYVVSQHNGLYSVDGGIYADTNRSNGVFWIFSVQLDFQGEQRSTLRFVDEFNTRIS